MATDAETMRHAIDAVERIMRVFWIERILYLLCASASFVLFLYAGYRLFSEGVSQGEMVAVFGASGLATAACGGIAYFLKRCFGLVEGLLRTKGDSELMTEGNDA